MAINPAQLNDSKNEFNQALGQQKGSALDKDSFMLLLVTQFKYQDPLNPMEDKEFIAQLAQFSSLEQLMNLNDSMGKLTEATDNQQMLNATSYIGKTVLAAGNSVSKEGKNVTKFQYALSEKSATGIINVYDKNNQLVYTETLPAKQAGTYDFDWTGKTMAGTDAPDGVYTVRMACQTEDGTPIIMDSQVEGEVSGVVTEQGVIFLRLTDGRVVSLANVRQVGATKPKDPEKPDEKPDEKPGETPDETPEHPIVKPDEKEELRAKLNKLNEDVKNGLEDIAHDGLDRLQEKIDGLKVGA